MGPAAVSAPRVDVVVGKPLDIRRFKDSAIRGEGLDRTRDSFEKLARHVLRSRTRVRVRTCYVCGSSASAPEAAVYGIRYLRCARCSHVYAEFRLPGNEAEAYYRGNSEYSEDYANPKTYRYRLKQIASPKVRFVARYAKNKRRRWLDVGTGVGDVVVAARRAGFDARGIEISESSVRFAKKIFGIELSSRTLEETLAREGEGAYDVVSFFGVLEHVEDPRGQVRLARKLLAPGGILVVEVPNADSASALSDFLYGEQVVRHMYPPFHIMAFTKKSLLRLARTEGFRPEAMWYFGLDFYNLFVHWGMQSGRLFGSRLADFMLSHANEFQRVIDEKGMSDEFILVARKGRR